MSRVCRSRRDSLVRLRTHAVLAFGPAAVFLLAATGFTAVPTVTEARPATDSPVVEATRASAAGSIRGDVNGDGAISAVDALGILSSVVGKSLPNGWSADPQGDVNCDIVVGSVDALIVLSQIVGKDVSQFCVGDALLASIDVVPDSSFVLVGATTQLSAVARDGAGAVVGVASFLWTSSDTTIVSVDQTGLVTARAAGTTFVHATVGGVSDSARVVASVFKTAQQTLRIELPPGVSSQGLVVLTAVDSTPVTDLQNTPLQLDPALISLVGVQDPMGRTVLLKSGVHPAEGATLTANTLSTATSLVLMHPFVAPVLLFSNSSDQGYAATIAGLAETQTLANMLATSLSTVPDILQNFDAATQTAVNNAALAFLGTIPTQPSTASPATVATFGPKTVQSGISITTERFDSIGKPYYRLNIVNGRARFLWVTVEDQFGTSFGAPLAYLVPPAPNLVSFNVPFADSRQSSVIDVSTFRGEPSGGRVEVKVYGPGAGIPAGFDEFSRAAFPTAATLHTQFVMPLVGAVLGVPERCAALMVTGLFKSYVSDNAVLLAVEEGIRQEDYTGMALNIVGFGLAQLVKPQVLANFLVGCGFTTATAQVMLTKLGSYAIPVVGEVRLAAKIAGVAAVSVPSFIDVLKSTPKETWVIENRVQAFADYVDSELAVEFTSTCKDLTDVEVPCRYSLWDFGDGTVDSVTSAQTSHTYASSGSYQAILKVEDPDGARATDSVKVRVAKTVPGAVAFVGCSDPNCNGQQRQIFFYDMLADTVKQLTNWVTGVEAGAFNKNLTISRDGNFVSWEGRNSTDQWFIFVPTGEMFSVPLLRQDSGNGGDTRTTYGGPLAFAHDGRLVGGGGQRQADDGNIDRLLVSVSRAGQPSTLSNLAKAAEAGSGVCTWFGELSLPMYSDGTLLSMFSGVWDPQREELAGSVFGPCEYNPSTEVGSSRFDVGLRSQGWERVFRLRNGGYVGYQSATKPSVWNASGSSEAFLTSARGSYFDMAYNWDSDVVLIPEGFFGLSVVAADGSDVQRRITTFRVERISTSPYPSGGTP
jgi:PKD repeat protein